jgi:hypothetical protein
MTTTDTIASLYYAAIQADNDWQAALDRAGVDRWSKGASRGYFSELRAAKVAAYDAFRIAAFPHASR